jgi:hypothetical protein
MIIKILKVTGVGMTYALTLAGCSLLVSGGVQNPELVFKGFGIALVLIAAVSAAAFLVRRSTTIED